MDPYQLLPPPAPPGESKVRDPKTKTQKAQKITELTARDERIAYWVLRGHTYKDVASLVGVKSTQTVWASIQRCLAYWQEKMFENINKYVAMEIATTLSVQAEAFAAWERSKLPAETERTTKAAFPDSEDNPWLLVDTESQHTVKGQAGDPRFLAIIDKCIERRCKILGLEAPQRLALTDPTGTKEYASDARTALIGRLLRDAPAGGAQESSEQSD